MQHLLIRLFADSLVIVLLVVTWAYFWPLQTDQKTLNAPASCDVFYPAAESSEERHMLKGVQCPAQHPSVSLRKPPSLRREGVFNLKKSNRQWQWPVHTYHPFSKNPLFSRQPRSFEILRTSCATIINVASWSTRSTFTNQVRTRTPLSSPLNTQCEILIVIS